MSFFTYTFTIINLKTISMNTSNQKDSGTNTKSSDAKSDAKETASKSKTKPATSKSNTKSSADAKTAVKKPKK